MRKFVFFLSGIIFSHIIIAQEASYQQFYSNIRITSTGQLSYLTISTTASSPYMEVSNNLSARWENGYTVMILGTYEYKTNNTTNSIILSLDGCTYDIPEIYRN